MFLFPLRFCAVPAEGEGEAMNKVGRFLSLGLWQWEHLWVGSPCRCLFRSRHLIRLGEPGPSWEPGWESRRVGIKKLFSGHNTPVPRVPFSFSRLSCWCVGTQDLCAKALEDDRLLHTPTSNAASDAALTNSTRNTTVQRQHHYNERSGGWWDLAPADVVWEVILEGTASVRV